MSMVMFNSYDKLPEGKPNSQIYQSGPNLGHLCCHQWNAEQEYWQCIGNEKFCWLIGWLTVLGAGKVELGVAVESRNHGEPVLKHLPSEISSVGTCANRLLSLSTSPTSIHPNISNMGVPCAHQQSTRGYSFTHNSRYFTIYRGFESHVFQKCHPKKVYIECGKHTRHLGRGFLHGLYKPTAFCMCTAG